MAWTTPKTWAAGNTLTAADMNTYVRDNSAELKTLVDGKIPLPSSPSDGEVLTYDSGTSAWVADAVPAGGKILQVVSVAKTNTFSTTSSTFVDVTGLTASITPSSASSKVLIIAQVSWGFGGTAGNYEAGFLRLNGGNADDFIGAASGSRTRTVAHLRLFDGSYDTRLRTHLATMVYLDSPATASSVTYAVQAARTTGNVYVNRGSDDTDSSTRSRTASSITVMEVAP